MKAFYLLILAGASVPAAAAPFCVVYAGGQMCNYYDTAACWQTARSLNGMCAANVQPQTQPNATQRPQPNYFDVSKAVQHPNAWDSAQRGLEAGQRLRQEREQHAAQMELMRAQTQAAEAQAQATRSAPPPQQQSQNWADAVIEAVQSDKQVDLPPPTWHVLYQCGEEVTTTPAEGCVVIAAGYF